MRNQDMKIISGVKTRIKIINYFGIIFQLINDSVGN